LTPQELWELGKRYYAKRELRETLAHLSPLIKQWSLQPDVYKEAAQMLLEAHLELGPPAEVVRYFEIIKEQWPDLEIPFEKILKVGSAYHEMGEYERSFLIYRAIVESRFMRETQAAGFLQEQGEFPRSLEVMSRLLGEYPPESYVAAATYDLAQQVYAKAPAAHEDPRLREKKMTRVDLVQQAARMLDDFLTAYPEDPAADEASFSLANGLLELKQFGAAIDACNRYAERYPESDYLDSYWYTTGYCHFARGEHEQALAMCQKVAEAKRKDPETGRLVESENRWRAIYILGQIHHSLGQAAEAIRYYTDVKERFADAAQAIGYFTRQAISLPEVTTVRPGEKPRVTLTFRNIPACDLKVYRIDLMKYSLLKRDLGAITAINLSGIRPHHEEAIALGDGKDYRDRTRDMDLPLAEEGAYLIVCRGENLHASGLVLVTPLAVEVQEEAASGRVRTTVKDTVGGRYLRDVHVKVIGSRNDDFVSGETDLRGVFIADDILGTSTIIALADAGRYAFYRGTQQLGPPPTPASSPAQQPATNEAQESAGKKGEQLDDLLQGLQQGNTIIQQQRQERLQNLYRNQKRGVQVKDAY
jgi:tetratricopeptide (TPR) repeat protein